ncbi:MAG: ExbD/TolR family protein [Sediminibacterium sp.]
MGRAKLPRKSTNIDMTAMCDVAFLLLSFFILTTKFKPSEAIAVTIPKSVAAKVAPSKDLVQVIIDKDGKVFLEMDDETVKETIANTLNSSKGMNLDVKAFKRSAFFGSSFSALPNYLALPEDQRKGNNLPGIPVKDSTNNELVTWMALVRDAYQGKKPNLLLKGDNLAKYPAFKSVVDAFKKNDFLKFQMVTNPEAVPAGTDLWKKAQAGEKREE